MLSLNETLQKKFLSKNPFGFYNFKTCKMVYFCHIFLCSKSFGFRNLWWDDLILIVHLLLFFPYYSLILANSTLYFR